VSKPVKNSPRSILAQLRHKAQGEGRNVQHLLRYYAIERFLYRLAQSPYADRFVLKGALIFLAWGIDLPRPTRDIDLRGVVPNDVATTCDRVGSRSMVAGRKVTHGVSLITRYANTLRQPLQPYRLRRLQQFQIRRVGVLPHAALDRFEQPLRDGLPGPRVALGKELLHLFIA
jgi:hypothetical protein